MSLLPMKLAFILNTSNYANGIYFFQFKNYESRKPLYFIKH